MADVVARGICIAHNVNTVTICKAGLNVTEVAHDYLPKSHDLLLMLPIPAMVYYIWYM